MYDIPGYADWRDVVQLDGGFSRDEKFRVTLSDGSYRLLVMSDGRYTAEKQREFAMLRRLKQLDDALPIPSAFAFGKCEDGASCYQMIEWIEGEPVDAKFHDFESLGMEAGKIMLRLHRASEHISLDGAYPKYDFQALLQKRIKNYYDSGLTVRNDEDIIDYLQENAPVCMQEKAILLHGDFHLGNLLVAPDGKLRVIDFNRMKPGPAALEFARMEMYSRHLAPEFCDAAQQAYFENEKPEQWKSKVDFFAVFEGFFNVPWSLVYGKEATENAVKMLQKVWKHVRR